MIIFKVEGDFSKWPQVGKLKQEDEGKRRSTQAKFQEMDAEADLLQKKLRLVKARADAEQAEWWTYIRNEYGLKHNRDFHITPDGRILMRP